MNHPRTWKTLVCRLILVMSLTSKLCNNLTLQTKTYSLVEVVQSIKCHYDNFSVVITNTASITE